jgi:hypothetical protein
MKKHSCFLFACVVLVALTSQSFAETTISTETATKGSTLKFDGRLFGGYFASQSDGPYANRSFDIPDGKLRFTFTLSDKIVLVNRFSTSRATVTNLDYLYADIKDWYGLLPNHTVRFGRIKMDFGEEIWTDNPVENILITNASGVVNGYDEGINFRGKFGKEKKPTITYSIEALNGTKDFVNSSSGLAVTGKLGFAPIPALYLSGSFYSTGDLDTRSAKEVKTTLVRSDSMRIIGSDTLYVPYYFHRSDSTFSLPATDLKIGELQDAPKGATRWKRTVWEIDVRWNYGATGIKPQITSDPATRFQLAATVGQFTDDATGADDRKGTFWSVEGLSNVTAKWFVAARLSDIKLDNDRKEKLAKSPVAVNEYQRLSLGLGYRLTSSAQIKAEGTQNSTDGKDIAKKPKLDQIAVGLAVKF